MSNRFTYRNDQGKPETLNITGWNILCMKPERPNSDFIVGEQTGESTREGDLMLQSMTEMAACYYWEVVAIGPKVNERRPKTADYPRHSNFEDVKVGHFVHLPEHSSAGRMWRGIVRARGAENLVLVDKDEAIAFYDKLPAEEVDA